MIKSESNYFRIHWVLVDELAIGRAPINMGHLEILKTNKISSILSLCSESEASAPKEMNNMFNCRRALLPDHKAGRMPKLEELGEALDMLSEIKQTGPVFVHCVAAMERSPLVCMAWLVSRHGLTPQESLDYLMQVHPGTNPLPGQLSILNKINIS
ncbi:dual specificity protein phosphatase [Prochlorococcus sp. MIT 1223]|uniref:protein-tyrosine phosphatase family protein n=1 Tax=Prochlorococcus sp. MIT 1223 TaxID=3096217 RepID=UPI002A763E64|nr:dual specificity protein phosphatase [Prochlorococcus sp. MIT 1223]